MRSLGEVPVARHTMPFGLSIAHGLRKDEGKVLFVQPSMSNNYDAPEDIFENVDVFFCVDESGQESDSLTLAKLVLRETHRIYSPEMP
jgi:hypothetical protein